MDEDHRELVRRLFAAATELTETAHEAAIAGQSEALTAGDCATAARRLQWVARDISALAEAATVIAGPSDGDPSSRPDQTPRKDWTCAARQAWIGGDLRAAPD